MKILLCTPIYNGGNTISFLNDSIINSLGNQSMQVKWIIANANSTDNTATVLESLIETNPLDNLSIIHIQEADCGMYDAIRKVFDSYAGDCEWMGWINCDDLLTKNCFGDLRVIHNQTQNIEFVAGSRSIKNKSGQITSCPQHISTTSVSHGLHDNTWGAFVQQEGIFFKVNLWKRFKFKHEFAACKLAGDWFLWMNLAKDADIYENIRPMAVFCERTGQLSENLMDYNNEIDSILSKDARRKYRENLSTFISKKFIVKSEKAFLVENPISLRGVAS